MKIELPTDFTYHHEITDLVDKVMNGDIVCYWEFDINGQITHLNRDEYSRILFFYGQVMGTLSRKPLIAGMPKEQAHAYLVTETDADAIKLKLNL